ncbi:alpha-lytic protease prodomain-containing protein [Streptomyces lancefieldiae]|uniref:Alpha-lytic protease prodomain-containing protein n=1 Tax=Streptomyces lancefieldiae TaxID=3075520 RepID=A0ABU3AGJ5_9ACTN|nr:alpha-lytic protease prodomain-containing protein [Streptomyces sp. DSM 40712]MDT0609304.1 alpha-lytic protease prodomain-containing protein [Streptomyces sp. DSM 40712]
MRRSRLRHLGLAGLLVLGSLTTLGTLPASAADSPASPASSAPSAEEPAASAGLLEAMRRDFGLTAAEAEDRLAAERRATDLAPTAQRAAGNAFGGSWFDADAGRLTVAVTADATPATVRAVRATGAHVRTVEHSARRLDAAKTRIDRLDAPAGVSGWHVDPAANAVIVDVVSGEHADNDVQRFVDRAREAGPVTVRTVPTAPRTFAAGTVGGDPYYTGNVRCSIGFSVHGGFVTAGHCGRAGAGVSGWDRSYIGTFQGSSFPDNDYAWVSVGSGWWTVPVVLGWGTVSDQLVRGSNEAPVGASVCRSGSTTHWHCGTVLAKNETVNYSQGAVHQMTKTSVCAEGGDSGGSFISGDQAQGVTSGGWGNCSSGGQTWFQPVNEILGRYGLTLHTA